jgi:hypothetical protein
VVVAVIIIIIIIIIIISNLCTHFHHLHPTAWYPMYSKLGGPQAGPE